MSRRAAAGDSTVCPWAATWTSPIRSSGGVGLDQEPGRAGPQRAQHVLAGIDGGQYHDTVGGPASFLTRHPQPDPGGTVVAPGPAGRTVVPVAGRGRFHRVGTFG
jgi:hypothetical protein